MTPKEKNDSYQRGYYAGRKDRQEEKLERILREERRTAIFCAALNGLLNSPRPSEDNGVRVRTTDQFVGMAAKITESAMEVLK